jgi:hypothetical protein
MKTEPRFVSTECPCWPTDIVPLRSSNWSSMNEILDQIPDVYIHRTIDFKRLFLDFCFYYFSYVLFRSFNFGSCSFLLLFIVSLIEKKRNCFAKL